MNGNRRTVTLEQLISAFHLLSCIVCAKVVIQREDELFVNYGGCMLYDEDVLYNCGFMNLRPNQTSHGRCPRKKMARMARTLVAPHWGTFSLKTSAKVNQCLNKTSLPFDKTFVSIYPQINRYSQFGEMRSAVFLANEGIGRVVYWNRDCVFRNHADNKQGDRATQIGQPKIGHNHE